MIDHQICVCVRKRPLSKKGTCRFLAVDHSKVPSIASSLLKPYNSTLNSLFFILTKDSAMAYLLSITPTHIIEVVIVFGVSYNVDDKAAGASMFTALI